jgi:Protein of unknown function (DUF559)
MTPLDAVISNLASSQAGTFSLDQARRVGFTNGQIAHRRRSGAWPLIAPGVIMLPGVPNTHESALVSARLALGPGAVASHWSAAALLGIGAADTSAHMTVLRDRRHQDLAGVAVHSTRRLHRVDQTAIHRSMSRSDGAALQPSGVVVIEEIRCTTASRTIIDLAPHVSATAIGNLIDNAIHAGLTTPEYLTRRLTALRGPGVAGVAALDEVLLDSGGHSWLERRFLRIVRGAGLRRPACQVVYRRGGKVVARVDFDFSPRPLVVEVSGRRGHSTDAERRRDAIRRNDLQAMGLRVIEFVTTQIVDEPDYVVRTLMDALA